MLQNVTIQIAEINKLTHYPFITNFTVHPINSNFDLGLNNRSLHIGSRGSDHIC